MEIRNTLFCTLDLASWLSPWTWYPALTGKLIVIGRSCIVKLFGCQHKSVYLTGIILHQGHLDAELNDIGRQQAVAVWYDLYWFSLHIFSSTSYGEFLFQRLLNAFLKKQNQLPYTHLIWSEQQRLHKQSQEFAMCQMYVHSIQPPLCCVDSSAWFVTSMIGNILIVHMVQLFVKFLMELNECNT